MQWTGREAQRFSISALSAQRHSHPHITAPSRWCIGGQGQAHLDTPPPPAVCSQEGSRPVGYSLWGWSKVSGMYPPWRRHTDQLPRPESLLSNPWAWSHASSTVSTVRKLCVSKWPLAFCKKCFIVAKKSLLFLNFTFAKHLNKVQSEITHTNFWDNENFQSDQTSLIYRYNNVKLCISKNYQSDNLNSALLEFIDILTILLLDSITVNIHW